MRKSIAAIILLLTLLSCTKKEEKPTSFSVGIITDCQYCDCDIKWNRYYRKSPERLREAVAELNKHDLKYTIHLGDFIDQYFESFDSIVPTWNRLKSPSYHVLGNHDFSVADSLKPQIFDKLNLKKRYYSFEQDNWKFIVLDGNDLSVYGALDSLKIKETAILFDKIKKDSLPYAKPYNGGIGKTQLKWMEQEINNANDKNVALYCHFPLLPIANDNLWNTVELQKLLEKHNNVKVFFNGHNHDGDYVYKNKIHYLTFKAMVNSADTTAFSIAKFYQDSIVIKGYGKEKNRTLNFSN